MYEYFKVHPLICFVPHKARTSPVAQIVKNLPAVQETCVQSLGWEDSLEEGTQDRGTGLQSMGSQRVGHD